MPTVAHRAARGGLRDGPGRQDALRRARPAARLRGAADHRRLSGRASTGRRTGACRRASACPGTTTWRACSRPGVREAAMQIDYDDEVGVPRACERSATWRAAATRRPFFLTVSFTHPHDPWEVRAAHWELYDPGAIDLPGRAADPARARPTRTACGCATCAGIDERPLTDERGPPGPARLLRGGQLRRRAHRRGARGAATTPASPTTRSSSSPPTTARCWASAGLWYKMSFFDGVGARAADRPRARAARAAARVAEPVSQLDLAPTLRGAGRGRASTRRELEGASLAAAAARATGEAPARRSREYLAEGVTRARR